MTLTEMAEYAVTVPRRSDDRYRLREVVCALCGFDEVEILKQKVVCAGCFSQICLLCGCVDEAMCIGGCSWVYPGICSAHDGDARLELLTAPTTAKDALRFGENN